MRFKRSDLPGFLIAAGAPPLLFLVFLASFGVWNHRGTPLLGFMAVNIALVIGLLAMFTRFVRNWDIPVAFLIALACAAAGVIWAQRTGADHTVLATTLKWVAILAFLGANTAIGWQVLINGLLPLLDRRAAEQASQEPPPA